MLKRICFSIQWICAFTNRSKHFCARGARARVLLGPVGPSPRARAPRAQKCFDRLVKEQIHWILEEQIRLSIGKGGKAGNILEKHWGKGDCKGIWFMYFVYRCLYFFYVDPPHPLLDLICFLFRLGLKTEAPLQKLTPPSPSPPFVKSCKKTNKFGHLVREHS